MDSLVGLLNPNVAAVIFGLTASAVWGTGDFFGGLSSRRSNVFGVLILSQAAGLVFMIALALLWQEPIPPTRDLIWGMVAGISGAIGLAALYASLANGQMGVNAPLIAVLGAAIPVLYGVATQGKPGTFQLIGFGVALIAVWLLSRPEQAMSGPPRGLGLAILAGVALGGFLIFIAQAESTSVFWMLTAARAASVPFLIVVTLIARQPLLPDRPVMRIAALSGVFDALGNAFFLLAAQVGRLDVASVLSSLYPVSTILLARFVLKERVAVMQSAGILLALIAIVLIAL